MPERHVQVSEIAVDSGNSAPVRLARSRSVTVDGAAGRVWASKKVPNIWSPAIVPAWSCLPFTAIR